MANIGDIGRFRVKVRRPASMLNAMRFEMQNLFHRSEDDWQRRPSLPAFWAGGETMPPDVDIREDGRQVTIEADLPGLDEGDVSVTFANDVLTIKGERKCEPNGAKENYYLAERNFGAFERSLFLSRGIDGSKIEARFDKGVLKIVAQKKTPAGKA